MSKYTDKLAKVYPNGPGHGVEWVDACMQLCRALGVQEAAVCVLGAWLGGVPEWRVFGDDIGDVCKAVASGIVVKTLPSVKESLAMVSLYDADLAKYLEVSGEGWQAQQDANRDRNQTQDLARLTTRPFEYLAWAFPDFKGLFDGVGRVVVIAGVVIVVGGVGVLAYKLRRAA